MACDEGLLIRVYPTDLDVLQTALELHLEMAGNHQDEDAAVRYETSVTRQRIMVLLDKVGAAQLVVQLAEDVDRLLVRLES